MTDVNELLLCEDLTFKLNDDLFISNVPTLYLACAQTFGWVFQVTTQNLSVVDISNLKTASNSVNDWQRIVVQRINKPSNSCYREVYSTCEALKSFSKQLKVHDLISSLRLAEFSESWKRLTCLQFGGDSPNSLCDKKDVIKWMKQKLKVLYNRQPKRLLTCKPSLDMNIGQPSTATSHPSLLPTYVIFETLRSFFIIHSAPKYQLNQLIKFSNSAICNLSVSNFILHQMLSVLSHLNNAGLSPGESFNSDCIFIDCKFHLQFAVNFSHMFKRMFIPVEEIPRDVMSPAELSFQEACVLWTCHRLSNYDYLVILNRFAGRVRGNPSNHPVFPWVSSFRTPQGALRNLARSKYRLNKGDDQLDFTYDAVKSSQKSLHYSTASSLVSGDQVAVPHHLSDLLTDVTYYVYRARITPKEVLTRYVRPVWVPREYPASVERLYDWSPDECIPEFYDDPSIFYSIHDDLPDLEIPAWAKSPEDFVEKHLEILNSPMVSEHLHEWIDLTFGYKLSGSAAVKNKNVFLSLVDGQAKLTDHGIVQLFNVPHPVKFKSNDQPAYFTRTLSSSNEPLIVSDLSRDNNSVIEEKQKKKSGFFRNKSPEVDQSKGFTIPMGDYSPVSQLEQLEQLSIFLLKTGASLDIITKLNEPIPTISITEALCEDVWSCGLMFAQIFLFKRITFQECSNLSEKVDFVNKVIDGRRAFLPKSMVAAFNVLLGKEPACLNLPILAASLIFQSRCSLLPFSPAFKEVCSFIEFILSSDNSDTNAQKELITKIARFLPKIDKELSDEVFNILLPYIIMMFKNGEQDIYALSVLFDPLARRLGQRKTCLHFFKFFCNIFERDYINNQMLLLYRTNFCRTILLRFGLKVFLSSFIGYYIEAISGLKEIPTSSEEPKSNPKTHRGFSRKVMSDGHGNNSFSAMIFDFVDEIPLDEECVSDGSYSKMMGSNESSSIGLDSSESGSRILDLDNSLLLSTQSNPNNQPIDEEEPLSTAYTRIADFYKKKSAENTASVDDNDIPEGFHVSDLSAHTIVFLSLKLGPILTSKYIVKPLLKMLIFCYCDSVLIASDKNDENERSVIGDMHADRVLKALSEIALHYGHYIVTDQFVAFIKSQLSTVVMVQQVTIRQQSSILAAVRLFSNMLPLVTDEILINLIPTYNEIIVDLIDFSTSPINQFLESTDYRRVLANSIVYLIVCLATRLGKEMSRKHLFDSIQMVFVNIFLIHITVPSVSESYELSQQMTRLYHKKSFSSANTDNIKELKDVFNSALIHSLYSPIARILGSVHLEASLLNFSFISKMLVEHEKQIMANSLRPGRLSVSSDDTLSSNILEDHFNGYEAMFSDYRFTSFVDIDALRFDVANAYHSTTIKFGNRLSASASDTYSLSSFNSDVVCNEMLPDVSKNPRVNQSDRIITDNWYNHWIDCLDVSDRTPLTITQKRLHSFVGHTNSVKSIISLDSENSFLSCSKDHTVKLWTIANSSKNEFPMSNANFTYLLHRKPVTSIQYHVAYHTVTSCDGTIHLWDAFTGTHLNIVEAKSPFLCQTQWNQKCIAGRQDGLIQFIDPRTLKAAFDFKISSTQTGPIRNICASPDGMWLAVSQASGTVLVFDLRTGISLGGWRVTDGEIKFINHFSHDIFVTSSTDCELSLWHYEGAKDPVVVLKDHQDPIQSVANFNGNDLFGLTSNKFVIYSSIKDSKCDFESIKISPDLFKNSVTSCSILNFNRMVLLGSDTGIIKLVC